MICQRFKPDPGNPAVRHYRGASRNVRHGETVNPSCNRKSGNGNPSPTAGRARSLSRRSSRQGRSLAGCESPHRQLPVFRRLAYPMRGEATNRVLLGRKSPGCPAGVFAAVGTIWGASKLGGRNITKYLQPRKSPPHEVVSSGISAGSRLTFPLGKADDTVEETGASTRCTAGERDPASKEGLSEITSGSCREQQGLGTTCKDSRNEAKSRRKRELNGSGRGWAPCAWPTSSPIQASPRSLRAPPAPIATGALLLSARTALQGRYSRRYSIWPESSRQTGPEHTLPSPASPSGKGPGSSPSWERM